MPFVILCSGVLHISKGTHSALGSMPESGSSPSGSAALFHKWSFALFQSAKDIAELIPLCQVQLHLAKATSPLPLRGHHPDLKRRMASGPKQA